MKKFIIKPLVLSLLASLSVQAQEQAPDSEDKQIEVISIFGKKANLETATGSAAVIDQAQLEQFEFDDIHRVLQTISGVYVREEDGYGLRPNIGLRGATTERSSKVAIMEDGVLIAPAPYAAPAAYYFPLVSRMSQVEVFKGPSAIQYGPNTVGGAINMISNPIKNQYIEGHSGSIDLAVGENNYKKGHGYLSQGFGELAYSVEGAHVSSDGFKNLSNGNDTGFEKNEGLVKVSYVPKNSAYEQFIVAKAGFAMEESNETYLGLTDADFAVDPEHRYLASQDDLMDWEHYQFQVAHYIELSDDLSIYTQAYHREFDRDWDRFNGFATNRTMATILTSPETGLNRLFMEVIDGDRDSASSNEFVVFTLNDRRYFSQGIETKVNYEFDLAGWDTVLDAGIRIHRDRVERDHRGVYKTLTSGDLVDSAQPKQQLTLNQDTATAIASYANLKFVKDELTASLGLRYESIDGEAIDYLHNTESNNTSDVILPGFGVFYQLNNESGLLFGVNKGFVPNSPGQDSDIDPEESWNYELGYRYGDDVVTGEVIGFFNDYRNLKGTCTFSSGCSAILDQEFNGGEVDVYGLEANLGLEFNISSSLTLPVKVAYTHTQSEFQTNFSSSFSQWGDVSKGDELPYLPEHQLSVTLALESELWQLGLMTKYVSAMSEAAGKNTELEGLETDNIVQLDLSASYMINDSTKAYFKVDNLTDEVNLVSRRPFGARPGKPRQMSIGLKYQF